MAQDSTILVQFKPKGHKDLINAINQLTVAQKMLTGQAKNYEHALRKLTNRQKNVVDSMVNLNTGTRNLDSSFSVLRSKLLLVSFGMTLVIGTAMKMAQAFIQQEQAVAMLDRHVTGTHLQNLKKWASEQQKLTVYGDEVILMEMRKIAAINDSDKVIKDATKLAMDYASATGIELSDAMDRITKTMVGQRDQFQNTTQTMREMNIALDSATTKTEKLAIMQMFLEKEVKGAAARMEDTFGGSLLQVQGIMGDMAEYIGEALVPIMTLAIMAAEYLAIAFEKIKFIMEPLIAFTAVYITQLGIMKLFLIANIKFAWGFNIALSAIAKSKVVLFLSALAAILTSVWKIWKYFTGSKEEDIKKTEKQNDTIHQTTKALTDEWYAVYEHTQIVKTRNRVLSEQQKLDKSMNKNLYQQSLVKREIAKMDKWSIGILDFTKSLKKELMVLEVEEYKLRGNQLKLDRAIQDTEESTNQILRDKAALMDLLDPLQRKLNKLEEQKTHLNRESLIVEENGIEAKKRERQNAQLDLQIATLKHNMDVRDMKMLHNNILAKIAHRGVQENENNLLTKRAIIAEKMVLLIKRQALATEDQLKNFDTELLLLDQSNIANEDAIEIRKQSLKFANAEADRRKEAAASPWWNQKNDIDLKQIEITKEKEYLQGLINDNLGDIEAHELAIANLEADEAELSIERWQQKFEAIQQVVGAYDGMISGIENYLAASDNAARQDELEGANRIKNEARRKDEIERINKKYEEKEKERRKEMYIWKVASAITNTAVGVTQVLADETIKPSWLKIPIAAMIAAQGAAQWGIIHKQTFEQGGLVGGRRHSQGGTMIEAEEGEFVMSRPAVQAIGTENLNRMNQGGGGVVNVTFTGNVTSKDFIEREAIPQIKEAIRRGADIGVS